MISYEITCFVNYKYIDRKVDLYNHKGYAKAYLIPFYTLLFYYNRSLQSMNLCKKVRIIRFLFILQSNHLSQNCHTQKC